MAAARAIQRVGRLAGTLVKFARHTVERIIAGTFPGMALAAEMAVIGTFILVAGRASPARQTGTPPAVTGAVATASTGTPHARRLIGRHIAVGA